MKIVITGATGALGSALVKYFSARQHEIIAVGRAPEPPAKLARLATYLQADITQPLTFPDADVCIHAAALSDDAGRESDFLKANVDGTLNVMKACQNCQTFIYVSSSSVYMPSDKPITEEMAAMTNLENLSTYGRSKLLSEIALKENFTGKRCFILRPRALYGPGDIKIFPRVLKLVKKNKINRPGSMDINVSLTHYSNFCGAVERCMRSSLNGIHTYNVSDEKKYVLSHVMRKVTKLLYGRDLEEKETPIWLIKLFANFHIGGITPLLVRSLTKDMVLEISKIKDELGYRAETDLDQSLPEIKNWVDRIGGVEVLKKAGKDLPWKY